MIGWRSIAGALLAVLSFELTIRGLMSGHQTLDPRFGWVWRNETVVHRLVEGCGVSHWREDATRVHDPAAGAPRVLVMGDSFTEALQVDDDEVFSARLKGIDALNVGRSAHSVADYVALADQYRQVYGPTWTIVEVGQWDFAEDAFVASKTHFNPDLTVTPVAPRFGRISAVLMTMRRWSVLLEYGFRRWDSFRSAARMPPLFRAADHESQTAPARPVGAPAPQWPVAREMQLLTRAFDGRITFLFIPPFDTTPGAVESAWIETCRSAALSCVDFRDTFAGFRDRGEAPFGFPNSRFGAGHLNARGHRRAADVVQLEIERLRRSGLF